MKTLGLDPGLSGAIAVLDVENHRVLVSDTPVLEINGKRFVDMNALADWVAQFDDIGMAYVEHVHAMPKNGVVSMFNFGMAFGAGCMAVAAAGHPWRLVKPNIWKKALSLPQGKDAARLVATQLMPWAQAQWSRKMDHNRAEAALLAYLAYKENSK